MVTVGDFSKDSTTTSGSDLGSFLNAVFLPNLLSGFLWMIEARGQIQGYHRALTAAYVFRWAASNQGTADSVRGPCMS